MVGVMREKKTCCICIKPSSVDKKKLLIKTPTAECIVGEDNHQKTRS